MSPESPGPGRVIYHGKHLRESLFWLVWAVFFGVPPLAIALTTPRPHAAALLFGLVLGGLPFAYSVLLLGKYKALILYPQRSRFRFQVGLFNYRRSEEHAYSDVASIELSAVSTWSSSDIPEPAVLIVLKGGAVHILGASSPERAHRLALALGAALGVPARQYGKRLDPGKYVL